MSAGYRWECPQPGCDYVAQFGYNSNRDMVIAWHISTEHPREPEFSEDPSVGFPTEAIGDLGPDVIIWDDPPPDPDRPIDNQVILDWYRDQRSLTHIADIADSEWVTETDEVRCGTWLAPAAFALALAAAAAVVYLSYRWSER